MASCGNQRTLPSSSRFSRLRRSISARSSASFSAAASFTPAISVSSASFSFSLLPAVYGCKRADKLSQAVTWLSRTAMRCPCSWGPGQGR